MLYLAQVEGFTGHFATVQELKAWAEALSRRYGLRGKIVSIYKAVWVASDGSGAQYRGIPTREVVIGG